MKKTPLRILCLLMCLTLCTSAFAQEIRLPENLKFIQEEAFYGDTSMESVHVPEGTEEIGESAFAYSSLKSIVLPDSLTQIADNAFEGCDELVATVRPDSYALTYCIENDIDYLFSEADLAEMYAISDLTFNRSEVIVCASTYAACEILIEVLSEEDERVLFSFAGQAGEGLDAQDVSVAVPETIAMPGYFILRAVLRDSSGNPLCAPYITRHYTAAFESFESMKPEDYTQGEVLNYGEHGFAVATSDAVKIPSVAATTDNESYTFSASSKPAAGDVLLLTTDGSFYEPIKVYSVTDHGSRTYTIVRDANATLADLYDVVKIDTVMDVGNANPAARGNQDPTDQQGGTGLSISIAAKNLTVEVKGRATVGVKTSYDKNRFGKDYAESDYYLDLTLNATGTVDLFDEGILKPEMGDHEKEWVLYDGPISLYGKGSPLATHLKVSVPLDYEFEAGGKFVLEYKQRCGFKQTGDNDPVPYKTTDSDCRMELGGGFMVQSGPKVTLSVVVLRGLMEGGISGQAGLRVDGEAVKIDSMELGEKSHACNICAHGEASWFVDIKADVTAGISEDVRVKLLGFDIVNFENSLGKLYISIRNDEDSPFGGNLHFDWGTCPNNKYRTIVRTKDINGLEIPGMPVSVLQKGVEKGSGDSPYKIYLYDGEYAAETEFKSGAYKQNFTVARKAQDVIIAEKQVELSGTVVDAVTGDPVSGARVRVTLSEGSTVSTSTNEKGYYKLTFEPVDSFGLLFSAEGYLDWTTTMERSKQSTIHVDAQLIPSTYTVNFHPGLGSGSMESWTVQGGTAFYLPMCTFAAPENMKFSSWRIGGESYSPGSPYTSSGGDVDVYASWERKPIPDDAVIFNGHAYKYYPTGMLWEASYALCETMGGHLATITSAAENAVVQSIVGDYAYIGGMDEGSEGSWYWITGEPWSYSNWNQGWPEPNNGAGGAAQNVLAIHPDGTWDDAWNESRGCVCEWDSVDSYELTFNGNGGFASVGSMEALAGGTAALPIPSRGGYTFTGWNTAPDGSGQTVTGQTAISSNVTLYAQWTKIPPAIPENAVYYNGSAYMVYDEYHPWDEASEVCFSLGGHLATITDEQEQAFIAAYLAENSDRNIYWIGAHCVTGTEWKWITGETFDYVPEESLIDYWGHYPYCLGVMDIELFGPAGTWGDCEYQGYVPNDGNYVMRYPEQFGFLCEWEPETSGE